MKNETEQKRGHLVRKMTLEKKETANDAHGGVRHKKGMNQARSGSKSPVCRLYAHGVRRVVHRGAPQVPPHCAVCVWWVVGRWKVVKPRGCQLGSGWEVLAQV